MLPLFKGVVRGFRRITAHIVPPSNCPICLDQLPVIGLAEAAEGAKQETHAKLACRHRFCTECVAPYVEMKLRAREVEDDQLVCPVVECKRGLTDRDMKLIGGDELLVRYKTTLKRVRDEKNPMARWCPRPQCGELILCQTVGNFTCPSCATVGCFHCRGTAHIFAFLCRAKVTEDASYLRWEKSVGDGRAVRACPRCQMRIWKTEGCNHMTCTHCRHQYCWVCDANWDASHYSCYEVPFLRNATTTRVVHQAIGYALIVLIVAIISVYGFATFASLYFVFVIIPTVVQQRHRQRQQAPPQVALVAPR